LGCRPCTPDHPLSTTYIDERVVGGAGTFGKDPREREVGVGTQLNSIHLRIGWFQDHPERLEERGEEKEEEEIQVKMD
jgi:hypothetical protein